MAHKQILFRSAAREKLLRGATQLADAIRVTLGPRSKSVLIEKKWGAPIVCNDGVTIAKEIDLKDPEENLGARMLRQAAEKTGDMVGDGTSTATILAHAIFADGVRNVVAGASAIDIKRGLDRAAKRAIEALRGLSRPVKTRLEKAQVGAISAHNDPLIGELVADAMDKVGNEGVITVEESKTTETTLEVEPRTTLLDCLRDDLGLKGAHAGCEHGVCGACTVLFDGVAVRSCLMFAPQAEGTPITTIEGVTPGPGELSPLQDAFCETHGLQCGYCTPAMILVAHALLADNPNPTRDNIIEAISGNLCRCTGYAQIVEAIALAADRIRGSNRPSELRK